MNPYRSYVQNLARLVEEGHGLPLGGFELPARPSPSKAAPRALIFSPHPDDEVIIGGLGLRLLRRAQWNVVNVAVTQGSRRDRQSERWAELKKCCDYIGFGLVQTREGGLEGVNLKSRSAQPGQWGDSVRRIREILAEQTPQVTFFPHADDWNVTHIGTHHLVVEALTGMGSAFSCFTVETEFWGAMATPNLLVESSEEEVADLIAALSFHAGEVRRNPYHLLLPAWMMDNVRRGGELVGGQGQAAPQLVFGTLYRLRRWSNGGFTEVLPRGRFLSAKEDAAELFRP